MKPEDRRSKLRKAAVSRGRMYRKSHLGFLPGFPLRQEGSAIAWMPVSRTGPKKDEEFQLIDEHLRRAAFGWNKLQKHFPRVLPKIVDDFDAWRETLPRLLEMLGRAIREGETLPESLIDYGIPFPQGVRERAGRLVRRHPELRPLIDTSSWGFSV